MNDADLPPSVEQLPAADIRFTTIGNDLTITQAYPVRQPESERRDFMVPVRASVLDLVLKRMDRLRDAEFDWTGALLSFATLLLGATLGAVFSAVPLSGTLGALSYIVFPILASASLATFFTLVVSRARFQAASVQAILDSLPSSAELAELGERGSR